jgi:hypothetical protein
LQYALRYISAIGNEPLLLLVNLLEWDEANESHLADHGLTAEMVEEVLDNDPLFFNNVPGRTATHVMIGVTNSGSHLRISILETHPGVWRPITGWRSSEAHRLWQQHRG